MRSAFRRGRAWGGPDATALLLLGLAVVLANLPALLGVFHLDPLSYRAELNRTLTPGLLGGRPTIDPSNGFDSQALGHLAAFDLLHLHLPWWNPYEATGMPLLGETQAAALFPLTLLTVFANGQLYEHILLELIAGICTFRLLRRLELVRVAAVAGGVAFALCGKFAWFSDATVNPLPFLPMLLLGIERALAASRDGRRGGWRLIAVAGALTAYAGFPEVAYPDVLMAVAWVAWRTCCVTGIPRRRYLAKIGLGAGVAVLLAGPMLLAMADYLGHADLAGHVGNAYGSDRLPAWDLPQLLMPYVYGPLNGEHHPGIWIMVGGYLSVVLVLLAGLGLIVPGRRGLKLVLAGWGLLVFARMYGEPPLLGDVLGALPEIGRMQFFRYATAALELPVILLAALGLDDLTRVAARRRRALVATALALAAVGAAVLVARPVIASGPAKGHTAYLVASIAWAALTAIAVGGGALLRSERLRGALLAAVVIVDAVVLFAVPSFSAPRSARTDLAPVAYLHRHLGEGRFFTVGPIQPNYGSYFRLASIRVDDFPPESYARYVHTRLNPFANFVGYQPGWAPDAREELIRHLDGYREAAVRYVVTHPDEAMPSDGGAFQLVFRSPTARIYRISGAASFFSASGCQVRSPGLDSATLVCRHPTTLVRRETWFAGWSAELNGHPVTIHRDLGLFQSIRVPAGTDRITFSFTPVGMRWALLGLLAGCLLLVVPVARRAQGQKQSQSQGPPEEEPRVEPVTQLA